MSIVDSIGPGPRLDRERADQLKAILEESARRHGVVGASLAVFDAGTIHEFTTGVSSVETGLAVTPRTRFLVGSTAKTFTAVMVMQLVDEARLSLDALVSDHLPDVELLSWPGGAELTVRHLLNHTSGIDNGPYADCGRGDDAVERYVRRMATVPPIHGPGERFGYSNAAYVVLGLLVERLTGMNWDEALRQRLLEAAGFLESHSLPEEIILHPVAVPHVSAPDGPEVAPRWGVADRAMGPTGSSLAATASDLVRFARLQLRGGIAENGARILSKSAVAAMAAHQVDLPAGSVVAQGWCVGWLEEAWSGVRVLGHTGHNNTEGSYLRFIPELDVALALTFNSPGDASLMHDVFGWLAREVYGLEKPSPWTLVEPGLRLDLKAYEGDYIAEAFRFRVVADGDQLVLMDIGGGREPAEMMRLKPANRSLFGSGRAGAYAVEPPPGWLAPDVLFDGFVGGRPTYMYFVVFALRRA
ncbi:MAG: serine hydrolase domain-containing protein [Candidatus Dormibacteria bacterium]